MARQLNMREVPEVVCSARSHHITYAGAACHLPPQAVKLYRSRTGGDGSVGYNHKPPLRRVSINQKAALGPPPFGHAASGGVGAPIDLADLRPTRPGSYEIASLLKLVGGSPWTLLTLLERGCNLHHARRQTRFPWAPLTYTLPPHARLPGNNRPFLVGEVHLHGGLPGGQDLAGDDRVAGIVEPGVLVRGFTSVRPGYRTTAP